MMTVGRGRGLHGRSSRTRRRLGEHLQFDDDSDFSSEPPAYEDAGTGEGKEQQEENDAPEYDVEEITHHLSAIQEKMSALQEHVNIHCQQYLRNELEITGIPETKDDNPYTIVLSIAVKIGIDLRKCDLDYAARSGYSPHYNEDNEIINNYMRPIVVRFISRINRDEFWKTAKILRLTTTEILIPGPTYNIYINERLTRENRVLFREARQKCRQHGWKYCWTSYGVIYVRRQEGTGAIRINTWLDLEASVNSEYDQLLLDLD